MEEALSSAIDTWRVWSTAVIITGLVSFAGSALAVDKGPESAKKYDREARACMSGLTNQDRSTCLKEVAAARQTAKKGKLVHSQENYEQNALMRCDIFQVQVERQACVRRVMGQEGISGSVSEGGILRESTIVIEGASPPPSNNPASGQVYRLRIITPGTSSPSYNIQK
jgi:hypothetical protein